MHHFGTTDTDYGVLRGPGSRGTYDGPELQLDRRSPRRPRGPLNPLQPKLHVWHHNQRFTFRLSLLELLRLAAGREIKLPVEVGGTALVGRVPGRVARNVLGELCKDTFARERRSPNPELVEAVVQRLELRLTPWLLAILERIDRNASRQKEPS